MKKTDAIFLLILTLIGCNDKSSSPEISNPTEKDFIIFGHFYGFCAGEECIEIYKITETSLFEDSNDYYPSREKIYDGDFIVLDQSKYEKVKELSFEIPAELLDETDIVIGMPDAADGGGIYLQMSNGRYWLIDMSEHLLPEYLHPLRENVRTAIALINE